MYAFSADRIPFQWSGFSLRWFQALAANGRTLEAAWLSVRIAAGAATMAVLLGGMAGRALARFGRVRARALFGALAGAPLVLPEVVTGLSLLLLFVAAQAGLEAAFGWRAERGAFTVLLARATLGLACAAVLVQARLATLDRSLEEAAAALGAGPFTMFRAVTLPLVAPALASFVSDPAGTTLPMLVLSALRVGVTPEVNALGVVFLALAGLAAALGGWALGRGAAAGSAAPEP